MKKQTIDADENLARNQFDRQALLLAARSAQENRDWETACGYWQKLTELHPEDTGAWVQLGNMRNELAMYEGAITAFTQAKTLDPWLYDAFEGIAGTLERAGRWEEACAVWREALTLLPTSSDAPRRLHALSHAAIAAHLSGKGALVTELVMQAMAVDASFLDSPQGLSLRAKVLRSSDATQSKMLLAAYIDKKVPNDAGACFDFATLCLEDGDYAKGLAVLTPAILAEHSERSFLWLAADLHERLRQWDKALQLTIKLSELYPADLEVLRRGFRIASILSDLIFARRFACAFARQSGGELQLIDQLRDAYERSGELSRGRLLCRFLGRRWKHSFWHLNQLARLTAATLGLVPADRLLRRRIETGQRNLELDKTYCEVAFRAGEYAEAERRLRWFLSLEKGTSDNLDMKVLLGYCIANASGIDDAEQYFIRLASSSFQAKEPLIGLVHMAMRRRDFRVSLELWAKIAEMYPDDTIAHVENARAAYNFRDVEEARRITTRRLDREPTDVTIGEFHAWLLVATGAYQKARDFIKTMRLHSGPNWSLFESAIQGAGYSNRLDEEWPQILSFLPRATTIEACQRLYHVVRLLLQMQRIDLAADLLERASFEPRKLTWIVPYLRDKRLVLPLATAQVAEHSWQTIKDRVCNNAALRVCAASDADVIAFLQLPRHQHPTVHVVNKFEQARGGSELHALDVAERIAKYARVELWAPERPHPHFSSVHRVQVVDRSQGQVPHGGVIVFIGVYFDVKWIVHAHPARVIFLYNTFEAPQLFDRITEVYKLTGVKVELLFCSNMLGQECGLPGLFEPSPIDIEYFCPSSRLERPFNLGRHSRDVIEKHHPEDWHVYQAVAEAGGRSTILGGTCMKEVFPEATPVELLPARSDGIAEYLRGLDAYFYRTSTWVEPWGRVVIEAMACGLPVLAHAMGGYAQAIQHEQNGLLFETTKEAVQLVHRLVVEPAMRIRLGEAARASIEVMLGEAQLMRLTSFYLLPP